MMGQGHASPVNYGPQHLALKPIYIFFYRHEHRHNHKYFLKAKIRLLKSSFNYLVDKK